MEDVCNGLSRTLKNRSKLTFSHSVHATIRLVYNTVIISIRKSYNKDFFKTWSSDMAYILGFLYADGNIVKTKRGNHYIAIYTADRTLLVAMAKCMQSEHKVARRNLRSGQVYRI